MKHFLCALLMGVISMVTVFIAGGPDWAGSATALIVFNIWYARLEGKE